MDKLSKTIQSLESGEIQVPHLELTDQQGEHLRKAIRSTFVARSLKTNRYLVDNPDECYFVERTLSELGILKPNKHMSAHEEFVGLLMVLQVEIPERLQPINVHRLADGNQLITTDFYPWKATPVETRDEELRSLQPI